jgi:hypothetical protein
MHKSQFVSLFVRCAMLGLMACGNTADLRTRGAAPARYRSRIL